MTSDPPRYSINRTGFNDVDRSGDPIDHIGYLDVARDVGGVEAGKRLSLSLMRLKPGDRVLDVGCGTGGESILLGQTVGEHGAAVGVDLSERMIAEARSRVPEGLTNTSFEQGDIHHLRFGDGEFHASRAERVLLHAEDPDAAIRELIRVTKRGGRVVAAETDVENIAFDSTDPKLANLLAAAFSAVVTNGQMGRSLRRRFLEAGLEGVEVAVIGVEVTDFETAAELTLLDQLSAVVVESGAATEADVAAIRAGFVEADARGTFALYFPFFVASGTVAA